MLITKRDKYKDIRQEVEDNEKNECKDRIAMTKKTTKSQSDRNNRKSNNNICLEERKKRAQWTCQSCQEEDIN